MIIGSVSSLHNGHMGVKCSSNIKEFPGSLHFQALDAKLMHSVIENDKGVIDEGKLISEAINLGVGSFMPELMFESIVNNFAVAKNLYGERLIREICGCEPDYIEKNASVPEFRRWLKKRIQDKLDAMRFSKLLERDYSISEKGIELAALVMYVDELEKIVPTGMKGRREHRKSYIYGEKQNVRNYTKQSRYRDIALRNSIKTALRRGHRSLEKEDLRVFERSSKGMNHIIYALDASGSMKGKKIDSCKRAGVALVYKALSEKDMVGLIVFGKEVSKAIPPTNDFAMLVKEISSIHAAHETNLSATIKKSMELFSDSKVTRHLILITDVLPTVGTDPSTETLEAVSEARSAGITISVVGINLDDKGKNLGEKIVEIGKGRFYIAGTDNLDKVVLEDYYSI
ncbi:MAG: VWA domain-containing protein [Candidatus Woesearchaeota archaeon]